MVELLKLCEQSHSLPETIILRLFATEASSRVAYFISLLKSKKIIQIQIIP